MTGFVRDTATASRHPGMDAISPCLSLPDMA
jgi:hypothetical protein